MKSTGRLLPRSRVPLRRLSARPSVGHSWAVNPISRSGTDRSASSASGECRRALSSQRYTPGGSRRPLGTPSSKMPRIAPAVAAGEFSIRRRVGEWPNLAAHNPGHTGAFLRDDYREPLKPAAQIVRQDYGSTAALGCAKLARTNGFVQRSSLNTRGCASFCNAECQRETVLLRHRISFFLSAHWGGGGGQSVVLTASTEAATSACEAAPERIAEIGDERLLRT
jgi:hypothetical protein